MSNAPWRAAASAAALLLCMHSNALAHGFAGQRFFPATILTDDPFVADEMSLPTVRRSPTAPDGGQAIDFDVDLSKRITPNLGITLGQGWQHLQPLGAGAVTGLTGFHSGLQYQLFIDGPREALALVGLNVTWAHTGRVQALAAPDFTTLTPTLNLGKGFGDLAPSLPLLRPFAITTNLSFDFATKPNSAGLPNSNNFNYGFALEYSLPYLNCCVQDIGLRPPFTQLIPLVEMAFTTPVIRTGGAPTTGTIQPGLIWAGTYMQIGAEAIIPINKATGHGLGGVVQLHFYLDDIFPRSIGRPITEWFK